MLIKQHLKQEFSRNLPLQIKDQSTEIKATKIKACSGKTFGIPPQWRQTSALTSKATNYIHRRHEMFQNVSIFSPRCQCVQITCTGRMKWLIHLNSWTYSCRKVYDTFIFPGWGKPGADIDFVLKFKFFWASFFINYHLLFSLLSSTASN